MAVKRIDGSPQTSILDGFTEEQVKLMIAKLDPAKVKKTPKGMDYLEGWLTIDVANQIFGFDGWNREIRSMNLVGEPYKPTGKDTWRVGYYCTTRITVFAGQRTIYRDGTGYGSGILGDLNDAHEKAVKEAETDSMKRALMTFGYQFGLALYDKLKENVMTPQEKYEEDERQFVSAFASDLTPQIEQAKDVASLGALYEASKEGLARVRRSDPASYKFLTEMIKTAKEALTPKEAPPATSETSNAAPAEPEPEPAPEAEKKARKPKAEKPTEPAAEPEPPPPQAAITEARTGQPVNPVAEDFELPKSLTFNPNAATYKTDGRTDWLKWARACIDSGIKMIEDETTLDVWEARHQGAINMLGSLHVAGHNADNDPVSGETVVKSIVLSMEKQRALIRAIAGGTSFPLIWNRDNKPGSVIHYLSALEWAGAFSRMANHPAQFGATFLNTEMVKRLMADHAGDDLGKVISDAVDKANEQEKARKAAQATA